MEFNKTSFIAALVLCIFSDIAFAQFNNIKNDIFWHTRDGQPIYSQGGGIFLFNDSVTGKQQYYWYGVHYQEADMYRKDPSVTLKNASFQSVTCYTSTDLVNWNFAGDVLTKEEVFKDYRPTWVGRLGVAYIKELKQYAMVVQHGGEVLIVLSQSPVGPFKWHRRFSMLEKIGTTNTGDQTVFTDDDGRSYLVYCYGKGRNRIYISEIGVRNGVVDLLDCTEVFKGESREGNCMFKYKGRYYLYASNIYGWDASFAYYLVADDVRGPYRPTNDMQVTKGCEADFAHISQTGFFVALKGAKEETIIYCGDRWADFAGNGLGYNQWCPLSFKGDEPYFNSLSSWNLDAKTGKWSVARDNNFIRNESFEADRNRIPSHVKPVQTELLGWTTTVIDGNKISLDSNTSPVLNYFNTEEDRKQVIGEKSLNITDRVTFKRKISQMVKSTPYVKLKDGQYTLTAKIRNSSGFTKLEMYAKSNGKTFRYVIRNANNIWTTIKIENIVVKKGAVEVGFLAEGERGAVCNVDDILLL